MTISVDDLKDISYTFNFFETDFYSDTEKVKHKYGFICSASFALSGYSGTGKSSGEWISVNVREHKIEIKYKTDGISGNSDDRTLLPADATKTEIEQAIREYV